MHFRFASRACLLFLLAAGASLGGPDEVNNLWFGTDRVTLSWDAEPEAATYNLYRSYIHELSLSYLGTTLEGDITGTSYVDAVLPVEGTGFFYLVTAADRSEEGPFGTCHSRGPSRFVLPTGILTAV